MMDIMNSNKQGRQVIELLISLNAEGKAVTQEAVDLVYSLTYRSAYMRVPHLMEIVELLLDNPICRPSVKLEKEDLRVLLDKLRVTICDMGRENFVLQLNKGKTTEDEITKFHLNVILLLDTLWPESFENSSLSSVESTAILYSEILRSKNVKVVQGLVDIINSRLPTTQEGWQNFWKHNIGIKEYLALIVPVLQSNHIYWEHYCLEQTKEFNIDPRDLPNDWVEELVVAPLYFPSS